MLEKRQVPFVSVNPADLIMKDALLSLVITKLQQAKKTTMVKEGKIVNVDEEALIDKAIALTSEGMNLQQTVVTFGTLGPVSTTLQPSNTQIRKIIVSTGALSLVAAIFVVFFLLKK